MAERVARGGKADQALQTPGLLVDHDQPAHVIPLHSLERVQGTDRRCDDPDALVSVLLSRLVVGSLCGHGTTLDRTDECAVGVDEQRRENVSVAEELTDVRHPCRRAKRLQPRRRDVRDGQAGDPEYLSRIRAQGACFSLGDGETKALDLRFK